MPKNSKSPKKQALTKAEQATNKRMEIYGKGPVEKADGTYCSPWCGHGCTKKAYLEAVRRGDALAKEMGPGWKPLVWENLGWHCKIVSASGRFKIYPHHHKGAVSYTAFISDDASSVGGRWTGDGPTAKRALKVASDEAMAAAASMNDMVNDLHVLMKGNPDKRGFYYWAVVFGVHETWVEDGFDLTTKRATDIIQNALPHAMSGEVSAMTVRAPTDESLAKAMGFKTVEEFLADRKKS